MSELSETWFIFMTQCKSCRRITRHARRGDMAPGACSFCGDARACDTVLDPSCDASDPSYVENLTARAKQWAN